MSFDIAGAVISNSGSGIGVTTNGYLGLNFTNGGIPQEARRAYFYAQGTTQSYLAFPNNANWNTMKYSTVVADNLGNYSSTSGAFTAPISGIYYFMANAFVIKPNTLDTDYFHPVFQINGSFTAKQAIAAGAAFRLRGRTYYAGNYQADGQINDIFYLTAGDYVNYVIYINNGQQYFDADGMFCGVQIS